MGRASNSFTSWVGAAEETINEDRVTLVSSSSAV